MKDFCKPPKCTPYELTLKKILDKKGVPAKPNQVIWYTSCDCFTPDLIIGKRLIIEVDGKVHDKEHRKTLDRIRKRALENMGYTVRIVRNKQVGDKPDKTAKEITISKILVKVGEILLSKRRVIEEENVNVETTKERIGVEHPDGRKEKLTGY